MRLFFSFVILILTLNFLSCSGNQQMINNPESGDIYICHDKGIYSPLKIDSVGIKLLYLFGSKYVFTDAIPTRDQIIDEEFDQNFHLIYDKEEIKSMYSDGKIVKIYR